MPIADAITINGVLEQPPAGEVGFGTVLIIAPDATFTPRIQYYGSAAEVFADSETGIASSDPLGLVISAAFSQTRVPQEIGLLRTGTLVNRVGNITVSGVAGGGGTVTATLTLNGVTYGPYVYTYGPGDTADQAADGLRALIAAATTAPAAASDGGSGVITLTGRHVGVGAGVLRGIAEPEAATLEQQPARGCGA